MHIPDNYLSVSTCAVLTVATAPVWIRSLKKVARDFPKERFSALGLASAFAFLAMMFNIPLPGGTTGHAVGGTVLAVLLGPEAACLALTIALALQALLFGDGGVLAFGANAFNMAFVLPFVGYCCYLALKKTFDFFGKVFFNKRNLSKRADFVALALASYLGINAAALVAAVEFGVQPIFFTDANGQALYCPYSLNVAIPAMAIGHLTLFGLAEAIFSVAVYAFVRNAAPDFALNEALFKRSDENDANDASEQEKPTRKGWGAVYCLLAILIAASPLGLLAEGTAWGEWGAEEIAAVENNGEALGYTPKGMLEGFQWSALAPDYAAPGTPDWLAYVLSAVAGVALSIILVKLSTAFLPRQAQ